VSTLDVLSRESVEFGNGSHTEKNTKAPTQSYVLHYVVLVKLEPHLEMTNLYHLVKS
jgi:hypothetical protein